MWEEDERESEGVEVCPEEKSTQEFVGKASREPKLFGELGESMTEQQEGILNENREEDPAAPEVENEAEPVRPVLTGRRKGGVFRRVVAVEPQVEGASLSGEQRLLILGMRGRARS